MMNFFRMRFIISLLLLCCVNNVFAKNSGLPNFGASCYFNAILQSMSHLEELSNFLSSNSDSYQLYDLEMQRRLITSLYIDTTLALSAQETVDRVDLEAFYDLARLKIFKEEWPAQHDSHELILPLVYMFIFEHKNVREFLYLINLALKMAFSQSKGVAVENLKPKDLYLYSQLSKILIQAVSSGLVDSFNIGDTFSIAYIEKKCKKGTTVYKEFEEKNSLPVLNLFLRQITPQGLSGSGEIRKKMLLHIRPLNTFLKKIYNLLSCQSSGIRMCAERGHLSEKKENDLGFSIEIPEAQPGRQINLLDCMRRYLSPRQLTQSEWWECKRCENRKVRSFTKTVIRGWPQFLIIQLVRFKGLIKNATPVSFSLAMGLGNNYYELRSFIVHAGDVGRGHYWALGKDEEGKWYRYDDSIVSEIGDIKTEVTEVGIDDNGGLGGTPYILFYVKQEKPVTSLATKDRLNLLAIPAIPPKLEQLRVSLGDLEDSLQQVSNRLVELKK